MDFEGEAWLHYDRFFRRQAAAEPARYPQWGEIDPTIWTQQFGRATARRICPGCGSREHVICPNEQPKERNQAKYGYVRPRPYPSQRRPPICQRWNRVLQPFATTSMSALNASKIISCPKKSQKASGTDKQTDEGRGNKGRNFFVRND